MVVTILIQPNLDLKYFFVSVLYFQLWLLPSSLELGQRKTPDISFPRFQFLIYKLKCYAFSNLVLGEKSIRILSATFLIVTSPVTFT